MSCDGGVGFWLSQAVPLRGMICWMPMLPSLDDALIPHVYAARCERIVCGALGISGGALRIEQP